MVVRGPCTHGNQHQKYQIKTNKKKTQKKHIHYTIYYHKSVHRIENKEAHVSMPFLQLQTQIQLRCLMPLKSTCNLTRIMFDRSPCPHHNISVHQGPLSPFLLRHLPNFTSPYFTLHNPKYSCITLIKIYINVFLIIMNYNVIKFLSFSYTTYIII